MTTKTTEEQLDALIDREQDAIGCPYPIFSALRDESPLHYSEKLGTWVCTSYEDIMEILHDTDRFSSLMPTGPRDSNIIDCKPEDVKIGARVKGEVMEVDEDNTIPQFRLV